MARGIGFQVEIKWYIRPLLKLFQNYLNNRKQHVVLNGSFSECSNIELGVPQGSILYNNIFRQKKKGRVCRCGLLSRVCPLPCFICVT